MQLFLDPAGGYPGKVANSLNLQLTVRAISGSVSTQPMQCQVVSALGLRGSVIKYLMGMFNLPQSRTFQTLLYHPLPSHPVDWVVGFVAEVVVCLEGWSCSVAAVLELLSWESMEAEVHRVVGTRGMVWVPEQFVHECGVVAGGVGVHGKTVEWRPAVEVVKERETVKQQMKEEQRAKKTEERQAKKARKESRVQPGSTQPPSAGRPSRRSPTSSPSWNACSGSSPGSVACPQTVWCRRQPAPRTACSPRQRQQSMSRPSSSGSPRRGGSTGAGPAPLCQPVRRGPVRSLIRRRCPRPAGRSQPARGGGAPGGGSGGMVGQTVMKIMTPPSPRTSDGAVYDDIAHPGGCDARHTPLARTPSALAIWAAPL